VVIARLVVILGIFVVVATAQPAGLDALTRPQDYVALRESSANPDLAKNGDSRPIEPGDTLVLGDVEGPGVITHLWTTVNPTDPFYTRSLVFRVYYDGNDFPSVEVPFGDFFAGGYTAEPVFSSAVVSTSAYGRARNSYWRMPFQKSARVTVTNESAEHRVHSFYYYLDWQKHASLPDDTMYFHARYRQEHPAAPGDFLILETEGRGHYAGTVQSVLQTQYGWFGEGDDRFYIDGEETPSLSGTGTEDYFGDAWGYLEFARPYYGVPVYEGHMPGDRVTAYRWHIPDPVPFTKSIRVQIEHHGSLFTRSLEFLGQFHERTDWVSAVAYWYQDKPVGPVEPLPPLAERVPPYRVLNPADLNPKTERGIVQASDGAINFTTLTGDGTIEFTFSVDEPGLYLVSAYLHHILYAGIYQTFVNDEPIGGPIDLLEEGDYRKLHRFDLHDFDAGDHTLRFECQGRNPDTRRLLPKGHALAIDQILLLRMEDIDGYLESTNKVLEERK
jgi:hypothetical protein